MVEFYKTIDGRVTELSAFEEGCWVNMVRPSSDEIDMISGAAGVEEEFVRAALDPEESSRVEVEEDQLLMIIDVPMVEKNSVEGGQQMFSTLPMGIVVGGAAVITVCLEDSVILRSIAEGAVKGVHTSMRTRFVFQILLRVAGRFLKNLRMIERDFTKIEKRLYDSLQNEELIQLLGLSKSLVYFSASLKGNEVTMEKVLRGRVLKLYEDDRDILEDALIEIRQAIEMAGIYSSILSGTMDAYASVVSNNLNIIMKVLTVLTIIMTIPNIVFGFYGMNIENGAIPGDVFWWIPLIISMVACAGAWYLMKKRNLY
ncbi:magnesium transporter CorA family protein [Butyricicoccus faecihominis]|uniref:magnesium transporter CorA family protein n=1 Tax=Butyricicoccus faecihominis TaxID=1712515 RepID=UPI0024797C88|nr:magnesium transporter CorA family protein [Butyricicoccus faecihominis]MCQ5129822.1 magnesium transporter CorA family protein [Butyricicoccus faecihominis]